MVLCLTGALLAVFGGTPPATAAPVVPCKRTFTGAAVAITPEDPANPPAYKWTVAPITVPASSNVEDIDVTYDITHPHASNLMTRLTRMVGTTVSKSVALQPRLTADTSAQVRPLTFDDEAAQAYAATSPAGSYRPADPLAGFDGLAAGATWRLDMANYENTTTARLNSWSVTISYTVCDGDGDGDEDHTDNCVGLANPNQTDLDGDGVGNECDGDLDGDGALNTVDNCSSVFNPDQADADRNGVGDACNGNDDGDAHPDAADGCPLVAAATASGCPSVVRTLSIDLAKLRNRLVGELKSGLTSCRVQAEVTLWRKRRGADRRLVIMTTDERGRYRTRAPRAKGKYYVTVSQVYLAQLAECSADRSAVLRVRRR